VKELQKVTITFLLVCSSLVAMAAADPAMSVTSQPIGVAIGETFTAEVTVDPAGAEIYGVQYDLYFDHTILNATSQAQGDFLSQGDAIVKEIVNTINNTAGKIEYAETRLGDVGGATTTGILASITFEVIGDGISTLTLSDVMYAMPDDLIDPIIGDLSGDGVITSADAVIALEIAVRGEYDPLADINGDGCVTSLDAFMIRQVAVGC